MATEATGPLRIVGRYALYGQIASGGMASVHFGRLTGPVGFSRTVAIKRLHEQLARDPEFATMFLDEAHLAAHIRHPNVVPTFDVVAADGELFLVMEYVQGESLARLWRATCRADARVPPSIATTIMAGVLHGLHAAHEATDQNGRALGIVHRDVSPQNILVGIDGVPRVFDFGVAKAVGRASTTRDGNLKGKIAYMAPEQLRRGRIDRRVDVYAAGVVLWELLTGQRLFKEETEAEIVGRILEGGIAPPSRDAGEISLELDEIVLKALENDRDRRFASAREMARALERVCPLVSASDIGEWVEKFAGDTLRKRAYSLQAIEATPGTRADDGSIVELSSRDLETRGDLSLGTLVTTRGRIALGHPRARRLLVFAAIGSAVALLVAFSVKSRIPERPKQGSPPVAHADDATSAAAQPSEAPPSPVGPVVAASTPAPHENPATRATSRPVTRVQAVPPARVSATATPTPTASCSPPWTIDADGNRHYKRECLR